MKLSEPLTPSAALWALGAIDFSGFAATPLPEERKQTLPNRPAVGSQWPPCGQPYRPWLQGRQTRRPSRRSRLIQAFAAKQHPGKAAHTQDAQAPKAKSRIALGTRLLRHQPRAPVPQQYLDRSPGPGENRTGGCQRRFPQPRGPDCCPRMGRRRGKAAAGNRCGTNDGAGDNDRCAIPYFLRSPTRSILTDYDAALSQSG